MVSLRCKAAVAKELKSLGIDHTIPALGEVEIKRKLTDKQQQELKQNLLRHGLELMDDTKAMLLERIKNVIIEMIHHSNALPKTNYSDYISKKLQYDYTYLSTLFSAVHNTTIQQCIIAHKIERVKELLAYDELTLKEISTRLHYSSIAHLANQFKKVTGLTTSQFKKQEHKKRIPLDKVCA